MIQRKLCFIALALIAWLPARAVAAEVAVEGAPSDSGYNVGTTADFRVDVRGLPGQADRYIAFADIHYLGKSSVVSVELDRQETSPPGKVRFQGGWPIPADAPTGIYGVTVRVIDHRRHQTVATQKLRGFAAYRKRLQIARLELDRTFYTAGDPIRCRLTVENLTGQEMKDLRVEFSNANYPWISTYSGAPEKNPQLALHVLREHLDLPAGGEAAIPMTAAGTAKFLQGTLVTLLGAGGPARHAKIPPPEVDQYTVAVWNADRTVLYDMQFTKPVIVRPWDRELPKPYSNLSYTHPYNSDIDFTQYREFYPPGYISPDLRVVPRRTLFRPGDKVALSLKVTNTFKASGFGLSVKILDAAGRVVATQGLPGSADAAPGAMVEINPQIWTVPEASEPGVYKVRLMTMQGERIGVEAQTEIAVNRLPSSLLVVVPHEDDEHSYAGLIRAGVEAGIPVHVLAMTGGDVGECERYYSKPCGPNESREFAKVRMEETREALEHLGLPRTQVSFLGLPDGGSGEIWFHHLLPSNPYLSVYLAADHAPYEHAVEPNLPFARDSVLEVLEKIISEDQPAWIALPHPDERHVDHRTANWFVIKACQALLRQNRLDPHTVILADQAYGAGGYKPAPYHYQKAPVYLSGQAAALKQEMSWIYQSQDGNLDEGKRQTFEELPREEMHLRILDWQEHEGWNE